ncbi:type IV secretory system conjugative DNA transfer VirD4/TraG family protein [Kribbella steppae]|uniref:Type IV secretory system conjugative DNA transfer VirD4/TraG family protein n=1 Tax=Kribbella steppae TaxID=2512223 RepID=A0A4R2HQ63_9ACTN|nr:type IV secretory system conjugative DNA transfer family protein [Kribbella steppae]TCO33016.1 type IV secretory system conjugative DNA transfer VirD4/TraG family protein [Kribbella steppae]
MPRFAAVSVVVTAAGLALAFGAQAPLAVQVGTWLAATGGVGVATSALLFWRVGPGLLLALPLWLGLAGAVASATGAPGDAGRWLIAAGLLAGASVCLVAVNRPIGGGLTIAGWSLYAGLLLRALPEQVGAHRYWWLLVAAGALICTVTVAQVVMSRSSSRGLLRRLGRAGRETDGLASMWDVWCGSSARVLRKKAPQVRPSLAAVSRWKRRNVALTQLGVKIARVGLIGVWSSAEDHTITFGGPRKGKTQLIMNWALDAPGALITTSTKLDVLALTYRRRSRRGPVWVFDPSEVIRPASKQADQLEADGVTYVRFNPLVGCENAAVAMDRAADLIDGIGRSKNDGQGERWDGFAKQTLQSLLHAAALGAYSMYDVQQWVAHPSEAAERAVLYELKDAGPAAAGMHQEAKQFFRNNPNTQSSISTTIMPALSWLSVPTAAASAAAGGQQFDVQQLLDQTGTVYLIGAEDKKTAPLVTALTAQIARQAKAIAAGMPGGRLDPFLSMVLDEAALICLIPLDQWSGDFGSRGICMHIVAQSRAQMRERFGDAATGALLTNTGTKIVFGGTGDAEDLQYWATLAGEREEPAITKDRGTGSRSESTRKTQVLTPGQVSQLRSRQMLVIGNGMPPAIVKARMFYQRWDVRTERLARKAEHAHARVARFAHWVGQRRPMLAVTRTSTAVEDRLGAWMVEQFGWMLAPLTGDAQVAAGGEVIEPAPTRRRPTRGAALRRPSGVLARLEAADPVREFVARLRLNNAMCKARAALAARTDRPVDREVRR